MSQSTITSTAPAPSRLRSFHLLRAVVSLVWVVLVLTTSASLVSGDRPTALAAVLLVVYPLWDVVATLLEARLTGVEGSSGVRTLNVVLGIAAAVAMTVAVLDSVGAAVLVFGVWAVLSGAVQLVVALGRRRSVGAQWPMLISGGLSVLVGAYTAATSAAAASGVSSLAGYAGGGAVWFLLSVVALTVRARRAVR